MYDAQRTPRPSQTFGWLRHGVWLLLASILFLASGSGVFVTATAQVVKAGRTVWDGVYTDAQADRATAIFGQSCSNCHMLTAEGNRRPLVGEKFWEGYTQKTVGDLLAFVKTNMPNGNGGSLPASTYNDLVALILKSNGFPPGMTELAPETIVNVQIIPKDGPGELPANTLVRVVGCLARSGSDWVLTSATAPIRIEKTVVGADDASRELGTRTMTLKFLLTRLDAFVGHRMSVTGLLFGAGGVDGLNVATVKSVAEACQ